MWILEIIIATIHITFNKCANINQNNLRNFLLTQVFLIPMFYKLYLSNDKFCRITYYISLYIYKGLKLSEAEIFYNEKKKKKYPTYHKQGIRSSFTNFSSNYDSYSSFILCLKNNVCNTNITTFNRNNKMSLYFFYFSFYHINKNLVLFQTYKKKQEGN